MSHSAFGAQVRYQPKEARAQLTWLLDTHGGRAERVAAALKVSRRTVDRALVSLGLLEYAAKVRARARATRRVA